MNYIFFVCMSVCALAITLQGQDHNQQSLRKLKIDFIINPATPSMKNCTFCGVNKKNFHRLRQHITLMHQDNLAQRFSEEMGKKETNQVILYILDEEINILNNMCKCKGCGHFFFYRISGNRHLSECKQLTDLREFGCKQCGKTFSKQGGLTLHTLNQHQDTTRSNKKLKATSLSLTDITE